MKIGKFLLVFVGISILLAALPVVGSIAATAGIAYAGYKLGNNIVNRSKSVSGEKENGVMEKLAKEEKKAKSRKESAAQGKAKNPYYDHSTGEFHAEALPLDMKADLANAHSGNISFDVAGIKDKVIGIPLDNDGYVFRFMVSDLETAQRVKDFTGGSIFRNHHGDASIFQDPDGNGFVIESSNAADIRAMLKAAYPSTVCKVDQEVRTVNQYIIEGCASYDEAVEKFKREKASLSPDCSYVERRQSIDGVDREPVFSTEPMNPTILRAGAFIVSEMVADARTASISVPGNIVEPGEISSFALSAFDSAKAEKIADRCIIEPQLSDATPKTVSRFLYSPNGGVHLADDASLSELISKEHPQFVFRCSDMKEAESLLSGGSIPAGRVVLVDTDIPNANPGEFIVTIPATLEMLSSLKVEGDAAANLFRQHEAVGVTEADVHRSLVEDGLVLDGYVSARISDSISTDDAKVNGVAMSEITERLGNSNLPSLNTSEEMNRWLADAAEIQAVSITLDAKKAELRVSSVVGGTQKTEIRKLSEDEMRSYMKRGEVSKAEMKDFLMQMHPDYFRTYSDGKGGCTLQNPVDAFLKGEKPQVAAARDNVQQAQSPVQSAGQPQKPVQKPEPKKYNGPKL